MHQRARSGESRCVFHRSRDWELPIMSQRGEKECCMFRLAPYPSVRRYSIAERIAAMLQLRTHAATAYSSKTEARGEREEKSLLMHSDSRRSEWLERYFPRRQ